MTGRAINKVLLALPVLALAAACGGPTYVEGTCDFLAAPDRHEGSELEFVGWVKKAPSGRYFFHSGCDGTLRTWPLTWRSGPVWEAGIFDETRGLDGQRIGGGKVTGKLRRRPGFPGWEIEATDYGPLRFDL